MAATEESAAGSTMKEINGDLFACPSDSGLAHCISADIAMGKGIAVIFKKKFGGVQELKQQGVQPGGVAVLRRESRFVYYLITKEKYWNKPTYESLESSLTAMCKHCVEHQVKAVCMPRIGCGLDGLKWEKVSDIIKNVFSDSGVEVTVYTL